MPDPPRSRETSIEPFPPLPAHAHLEIDAAEQHRSASNGAATAAAVKGQSRRRRASSNVLPGEMRGDTGAQSLATMSHEFPDGGAGKITRTASDRNAKPGTRGYKRRKAKTLLRRWKSLSLRHTWLNPLLLTLLLLSAYAVSPGPHNPLSRAIFLSYPIPGTSPVEYGKGGNDFAFVAFYTVVLSFVREFLMQRLIRPMAVWCGVRSRAKQSRFMEQVYTAIYFGIMGPFGVYVMRRSPIWYFDTDGMFEGFPHRQHEGVFKAYYLLQAAYWSQQAIVLLLQLEKPRKDFKELVAHHIVTIALIWLSYRFHFAYMGLAVYITHDVSDFFLATSKTLSYVDSPLTVPWFTVFLFVWGYARHYINLRLIVAVLTDFATVGPFELNWETQQYKCWISQYITFALLASLQCLNLFWSFLILRIAKRITFDSIVADERSEGGDSDEEEEDVGSTEEKRKALGIAVGPGADRMAGVNGSGGAAGTPKVLLNGVPVESGADAHSTTTATAKSSGAHTRTTKGQNKRQGR